jgi:hypothetical protein
METPTQRWTRARRQEIRDRRRYLEQDGRFREIVRTVRRFQDGPQRREALRRFWHEVYDGRMVQAQEDYWPLRRHLLSEDICLADENRKELQEINSFSSWRSIEIERTFKTFCGRRIADVLEVPQEDLQRS